MITSEATVKQIAETSFKQIAESKKIALICHKKPDMDALSSMITLKRLIKNNLNKEENHKHIDTGDMVRSVGTAKGTKAKKFHDIYPQGRDEKGVRNAEKAFIAHYGKSGQLGTRFVDEAESNSGAECAVAMQKKLDE